jgi:hypothetical protein
MQFSDDKCHRSVIYTFFSLINLLTLMQIHKGSSVFASAVASRLMEVVDEY